MANDSRNFRADYYKKLESPSISTLLNKEVVNLDELKNFVSQYPLTFQYRPIVWQLLLGILPIHCHVRGDVWSIRKEQFDILFEGLMFLNRANQTTLYAKVLRDIRITEQNRLRMNHIEALNESDKCMEILVEELLLSLEFDETNLASLYWLSKCFIEHLFSFRPSHDSLVNFILCYTIKEEQKQVHSSVKSMNNYQIENLSDYLGQVLDNGRVRLQVWLGLKVWINTCFAKVLPSPVFLRVCDKVIVGSWLFLVYITIAIFFEMSMSDMKACFENYKQFPRLSEEKGKLVFQYALDLGLRYGYADEKQ